MYKKKLKEQRREFSQQQREVKTAPITVCLENTAGNPSEAQRIGETIIALLAGTEGKRVIASAENDSIAIINANRSFFELGERLMRDAAEKTGESFAAIEDVFAAIRAADIVVFRFVENT